MSSRWFELPAFILEQPQESIAGKCSECDCDLFDGSEIFYDINDLDEIFCSLDCCIEYYKNRFVIEGTLDSSNSNKNI